MRLIDADRLKEEHCEGCNGRLARNCDLCGFVELINDQPTVDAVPVVRCEDCKHYEKQAKRFGFCSRIHNYRNTYGWCLDGERREKTNAEEEE